MEQPHAVSLERLYSEYGNSRIVGLCQQKPGENLLPYFSSIIRYDSSEKEIISSLEKLRETAPGSKEISLARELISEREKEVLRGVALGMTNKEISDMLFISSHTVITHRKNITAKLGIKTIAGLAVYAVLNGIIDPEEMEEH
ncbi:MAG: LuxR family transcriptional regulator [Bacteroidales bacterium]|nr:LuxR family transcriptional regulator [Bacteroidales bacterium]